MNPSLTDSEARDELFSMVLDGLTALAPAIVGYVPTLRYQDVVMPGDIEDRSKYHARVSREVILQRQSSLKLANRVFTTFGLVTVQLYSPMSAPAAGTLQDDLAQAVKRLFRGRSPSGSIWFRDATVRQVPQENALYRRNVVAAFQYDERTSQ